MTTLPERAADTTAEQPWPVRLLSMKIGEYVEKMSTLWVEGQVVQLNRRPGAGTPTSPCATPTST
jgi:exodeoxyribonuclease VII large subunit